MPTSEQETTHSPTFYIDADIKRMLLDMASLKTRINPFLAHCYDRIARFTTKVRSFCTLHASVWQTTCFCLHSPLYKQQLWNGGLRFFHVLQNTERDADTITKEVVEERPCNADRFLNLEA